MEDGCSLGTTGGESSPAAMNRGDADSLDSTDGPLALLHVISDIHLEYYGSNFRRFLLAIPGFGTQPAEALANTYLILAGDIGDPGSLTYAAFIRRVSSLYRAVIVIAGNHEYYHTRPPSYASRTMAETDALMQRVCSQHDNVHLLRNSWVDLGPFAVIGSTLWGALPDGEAERLELSESLSDFSHIYTERARQLTPEAYEGMGKECRDYLRRAIREVALLEKPVVVVTHHAPDKEVLRGGKAEVDLRERFGDLPFDSLAAPYASAGMDEVARQTALWVHGHVHCSQEVWWNGTRVLCNALGYKDERNAMFAIADIPLFPR
eukprot:Sspe_Gene.95832::Locus_68145_Transcript_1_1_Confidence_1.000_Length_1107::g.95832::m.95832